MPDLARCYRRDGNRVCGAFLKLHIGPSPMPEWDTIVVQTCLAGHVHRVQGVLTYVPDVWADSDPGDCTTYGL